MWLKQGAALITVLLIALSLAGCKTDDSFDSATDSSASNVASTAAPWWKGRSPGASTQHASDGIAPSFNSTPPKAVNGGNVASSSQGVQPVRDVNVARTVDSLAAVATPGNHAYRIGPLDVLDISVFQAPDLSKTVEVADNGTVDLPLIGETPAAGKTAQELQRDLNSKLGAKYLQNPQVTVIIKEFNSSRVTVSGAVKSPGVFPYKGETLMQYVSMAGGLAQDSNNVILVLRQDNGKRSAAKFNLADIQTGRANDPTMQSGDVIVADTSVVKQGLNNILKVLPLAGFAALL
jgi:polysaccharide export outer membrane protein